VTALVVGIGNCSRGDDGAGPEVATRVAELDIPGVHVIVEDEPLALIEHFAAHDDVIVVDAVKPGGDAGRVHVRVVGPDPLPRHVHAIGSHGLGVVEAVELARALGRLPRRLTLIGSEAETLSAGAPLSAQVADRLVDAVRAVEAALLVSRPADRSGMDGWDVALSRPENYRLASEWFSQGDSL
jgi:hydrogenase maturation protease